MKVKFTYILDHKIQKEIEVTIKNNFLDINDLFDLIKKQNNYKHCYILKKEIMED